MEITWTVTQLVFLWPAARQTNRPEGCCLPCGEGRQSLLTTKVLAQKDVDQLVGGTPAHLEQKSARSQQTALWKEAPPDEDRVYCGRRRRAEYTY